MLRLQADGAVVIDGRPAELFASGHLRGSINVGLDGRFAEYAGDVLRPGEAVVLVTEPGRENEARIRLARIGFDHVVGALDDIGQVLTAGPSSRRRRRASRRPSSRRGGSDEARRCRSSTSATPPSVPTG